MFFPKTSANRTFQQDLSYLAWKMDDLNRIFLEKLFCLSVAEIVIIWILFFIELPVICLAVYGLCFRSDQAVPTFIVNLFISDIIQICVRPFLHLCTYRIRTDLVWSIYIIGILANIGFMVVISLERYILIKYPIWYRSHSTFKLALLLCLVVWTIPVIEVGIVWILVATQHIKYAFCLSVIPFLLPYPLVIFSFVGSWKALTRVVSITPDEKNRILMILALVLSNYTVLFLPSMVQCIIFSIYFDDEQRNHFGFLQGVSGILMYLNPLADSLLYVFIRKDVNSLLRCLCCKKVSENQVQSGDSSHSASARGDVEISA